MTKWIAEVVPSSSGLEETGYAHIVRKGDRQIIVRFHHHRNYDRIVTTDVGDGYVRSVGVGRRKPDLRPHPEAIAVMNALNNL